MGDTTTPAVVADLDKLLPSEHECFVHIYPSDLARMEQTETPATVFSVAVGCPGETSVPLYTRDQVRAAMARSAAPAPTDEIWRAEVARLEREIVIAKRGNAMLLAENDRLAERAAPAVEPSAEKVAPVIPQPDRNKAEWDAYAASRRTADDALILETARYMEEKRADFEKAFKIDIWAVQSWLNLNGFEPLKKYVRAAPVSESRTTGDVVAYLATDLDGRGDVAFTVEEAKRRAGYGCDTIIPLSDAVSAGQAGQVATLATALRDLLRDVDCGVLDGEAARDAQALLDSMDDDAESAAAPVDKKGGAA